MAWTYIPGSGKISLEGVEFAMTDGTHTRRCFISQQEIDKWAGHVGKIDQNIAFDQGDPGKTNPGQDPGQQKPGQGTPGKLGQGNSGQGNPGGGGR